MIEKQPTRISQVDKIVLLMSSLIILIGVVLYGELRIVAATCVAFALLGCLIGYGMRKFDERGTKL